jgi:hypothetical protein
MSALGWFPVNDAARCCKLKDVWLVVWYVSRRAAVIECHS